MDLILSQNTKSYVTRLVCNKMLIVPYIIKCKSMYAPIYYTDSKLQCHMYLQQCGVHLQCIPFVWIKINYTHLDFYLSKKYVGALH